jgi:A/G-specific adenine glycosylase
MSVLIPLISWYNQHKRDLPWRATTNPYYIWLSEVIMQQTQVKQGLPYYNTFINQYPTIADLAAADDDEVMKLWQGLGYYSRASNMLKTARIIVNEYGGVFPDTYQQLIKLKGIGPYTAAAISSFAFNEAQAVVDGNVFRVLARLFAIDVPINSTNGKKLFAELAQELLNLTDPATHNQAIMELGAMVCKPKQAECGICVMRLQCEAFKQNKVYRFPVKAPKRKPVNRYLNYLYFIDKKGNTFIRQRLNEGIWDKLYEFPLIELAQETSADVLLNSDELAAKVSSKPKQVKLLYEAKHQLTHQTIYARFWLIDEAGIKPIAFERLIKININDIHTYAVPRLLERFINHILPK